MARSDRVSFYFFDFDDNIMFLPTPAFLLNEETGEPESFSTGDFAAIRPLLGQTGPWEHYAMFDGSYARFEDIPRDQLAPGQKQHFVRDIERAIDAGDTSWQAPSWPLFVYACTNQRPVSIITARNHSPETIRAGVRVLVEKGWIPQEPNYLTLFPVGNDRIRGEQLGDRDRAMSTPQLKHAAIVKSVAIALERYGSEPEHRFGMSDDDPQNIQLIVEAMCECKRAYPDKRFFVIDTGTGETVKLEVFPVDLCASQEGGAMAEPLA